MAEHITALQQLMGASDLVSSQRVDARLFRWSEFLRQVGIPCVGFRDLFSTPTRQIAVLCLALLDHFPSGLLPAAPQSDDAMSKRKRVGKGAVSAFTPLAESLTIQREILCAHTPARA